MTVSAQANEFEEDKPASEEGKAKGALTLPTAHPMDQDDGLHSEMVPAAIRSRSVSVDRTGTGRQANAVIKPQQKSM